jgi:hypothetical protein
MNSVWDFWADTMPGWFEKTLGTALLMRLTPTRWPQLHRRIFLLSLVISGPLLLLAWAVAFVIQALMTGVWVVGAIILIFVYLFIVGPLQSLFRLWK